MDVTDRSSLPRRPLPRAVDDLAPLGADFDDVLDAGLSALAIELTPAQRAAIEAHVRLLLTWNEHINLSGLRSPADVARGHVDDALLALPKLSELARGKSPRVLYIGSGGGFPGLPLAVVLPARRAALVDSIAKKADFLAVAGAVATAELADATEITALNERVEDLADESDQRESWDLVCARAVGSVAECAEIGLPLASRGGHVVIWKRASDAPARRSLDAEIAAARRIIQAAGGAAARIAELKHGDAVGLRGACLVIVRKVRPTPDRYPRSPGERRKGQLP
jgi:16S rRNA (guanine527-N7)-methyltransferase